MYDTQGQVDATCDVVPGCESGSPLLEVFIYKNLTGGYDIHDRAGMMGCLQHYTD